MNTLALLLVASVVYSVLVYWTFGKFKLKDIWFQSDGSSLEQNNNRLTNTVKRILDLFFIIYLVIIILWLPFIVIMTVSQIDNPSWGIDIVAFSGFRIDVSELQAIDVSGLRNSELRGKTGISIDTSDLSAWYLFAISNALGAVVAFYGLVQLRALVISLKGGAAFSMVNVLRIRRIGIVLLAWNIGQPFLQYFAWGTVIQKISFSSAGMQLFPAFEINDGGILVGVMMIVLSGMLREAVEMKEEQELTI